MDSIKIAEIVANEVLGIRQSVLRPQLVAADCVFDGDDEPSTFHLGAFDGEELIGIATVMRCTNEFFPSVTDTFRLRGMAVVPDRQGCGIGTKLLESAMLEAQLRGCATFWCNARQAAKAFYGKAGFRTQSDEPFDVPGVGLHYVMVKSF